jgi:transposase-like protein
MGRRIDAAAYAVWRKRWERFESSSLTVAEFCRREGVSQPNFYQWRKRLRRERSEAVPVGPREAGVLARPRMAALGGQAAFVELAVACPGVVELELPNGVRVRVPADREAALVVAIRAASELVNCGTTPRREAVAC